MVNWHGNYVIKGVLLANFSLNVSLPLCSFPPPHFFSSSPPFIHLRQRGNAVSHLPEKVPISLVSGHVCWAAWPISTAQWTRQGSKGVKCKSNCECLPDWQLELHHCQQQREMWSSLFIHSPSTVALTRTVALIYVIPAATISAVSMYEMNPDLKKGFPLQVSSPLSQENLSSLTDILSQSVILFYMF